MTLWTWLWLAWLVIFLAVEIPGAVKKRQGATLSEHVWEWFSVKDRRRFWLGRRLVLGGFLVSLTAHLVFGTTVIPVIVLGSLMAVVIVLAQAKEA